jgi:NAD(P)-dependent dehydrogenase (short-subunit alcohol dehydrogenase family)
MDLQLTNKRAIVTGSTGGIGLAIAIALAKEGAAVIINGRTAKRVDDAIAKIKEVAKFANVTGVAIDLSNAAGCDQFIQKVPDADILVNNLGIFEAVPFEQITDDHWQKIWEANVMSGVHLSRHYLPRMRKSNWGRIIFISSESGLQIPAEMIHYGVTKTAQIALARGLAETTAGTGVTVNSILPGPTASEGVTDFVSGLAKQQNISGAQVEKEFFEKVRPSSLLKRFITTEEVASMVAYIASPLSLATNGAAIRVDGGVVRAIA